jgi:hypothetical protein
MHLPSILALLGIPNTSVFDEMLRLIGVAAIVHAFFKGVKSLIKPDNTPLPAQPAPSPTLTPVAQPIPAQAPVIQQPEPVLAPCENTITADIVAIIAAAVAAATDSTHRVVSIKYQSNTWEKVGRQSVLTSHRIR